MRYRPSVFFIFCYLASVRPEDVTLPCLLKKSYSDLLVFPVLIDAFLLFLLFPVALFMIIAVKFVNLGRKLDKKLGFDETI